MEKKTHIKCYRYLRAIICLCILVLFCGCTDQEGTANTKKDPTPEKNPNEHLLDGKGWSFTPLANDYSNGNLQGSAVENGVVFFFRNAVFLGEKILNYDTYNIKTGVFEKGKKSITCARHSHAGSASFAPSVVPSYEKDGIEYKCTLPFVYLSGHYETEVNGKLEKREIVDVVDIENDVLINRFTFPDRTDDIIAAYDFENGRVWLLGYEKDKVGMSPYIIEEYHVDLLSMTPKKVHFSKSDLVSLFKIGGPNSQGIQETLDCGTVQDIDYHNGYLYFAVGRGSDWQRTEWAKIHVFDISMQRIVATKICPDKTEPEGLFCYEDDIYMTTLSGRIWKLSEITEYDNIYNFEPAKEVSTDNYEISNASQMVWFISQVYCGRTTINGKLTTDIDMSTVEDPFTFYVYDVNVLDGKGTTGRLFEAHYAFRGTFDGQGHTIHNFFITSTPFYNNGLFPYAIDATFKDLTINGHIILTEAEHGDDSSYDIQNVGLIGYMNGGTLSNIDVTEFYIRNPDDISHDKMSKLTGNCEGNITIVNCKYLASHGYDNGICPEEDCPYGKYEAPAVVNDVFQISNAGNLWWLAQHVNSYPLGSKVEVNAELTNDIDMQGIKRGSFPGIGKYGDASGKSRIDYAGTFDGHGFSIHNFYKETCNEVAAGLFNQTNHATIKNFNIDGNFLLLHRKNRNGVIVGEADNETLVENISSSVNIICHDSPNSIGGIVGYLNKKSVVNRCSYSGTINTKEYDCILMGGICGAIVSYSHVNNCLFDGNVISNTLVNIGGIVGGSTEGSGSIISNCLSCGTMNNTSKNYNQIGAILGCALASITLDNDHYCTNDTVNIAGMGTDNKAEITGSPIQITNYEDLTNGNILQKLGAENWYQGADYPIPLQNR